MTVTKDNFFKKTPPNTKINKSGIEDAKFVEVKNETSTNNTSNQYANDIKDQKTIDANEIGKKDPNQKMTIDFMNEGDVLNYTASKSKDSINANDTYKSQFDGKTIDDVKSDIKNAEIHAASSFTPKDYEEMAGFVIDVIDVGLSQVCKWWSKEPSATEFSLGKESRNRLVRQLTLILCKYQSKFSLEMMFILTLVFLYGPALLSANKKRKEKAEKEAESHLKVVHNNPNFNQTPNQQPIQQQGNGEQFNTNSNINEPNLHNVNNNGKAKPGPKRKTKPHKL